jgi:integrase/recombinase XerD
MTPLRAKYIQDLVIRGRSENTQEAYTRYVCDLARYYRRSPALISYEEVTGWLYHLIKERQLSASTVNIAVSAVRFLYAVTLGRETFDLMASVSEMKRAPGRAEVYAHSEVEAILTPPRQPRGRPMTPLRAKFIRDLVVRGRSKNTQEAYIRYVRDLARYYRRSPELISYEEVTDWMYHLITERLLSASSVNVAVNAVRFLYAVTLGRETLDLMASVPHMKRYTRRAQVYARSEVEAILTAPRQPRDRALLMTVYGCGLRISEATQLKTSDIDRPRMQLRVRNGKGAKGRVLPLSQRLLQELENYWRAQRQGKAGHDIPWLFLGKKAGEPMGRYAGQSIYYSALKKSGVRRKGGIHLLRHSFATHLMESGVELPVMQHLLGHSSLRTTALYLHVTARRLAEVRSPLDLIGSGCLGQ